MRISGLNRRCWQGVTAACLGLVVVCGSAEAGQPFEYVSQQLLAPGGQAGDWFGYSVAVGNGYMVSGAIKNDAAGDEAGAVYVYNADTGAYLYRLIPADIDPGDHFGYKVAIEGNLLAVSAPYDDVAGASGGGSVYLYDLPSGTLTTKFIAPDISTGEQMGWSLDITQGVVVAGAIGTHRPDGVRTGSVYAFSTQFLIPLTQFIPADGTENAFFGADVEVTTSYLAISAPRTDIGLGETGAVYIYSYTSGELLHKLVPNDPQVGQGFGDSIAISGDRIFVSAPFDHDLGNNVGAVYVFDAVSGSQITKILPPISDDAGWFGNWIAVDGDTLLISSQFDSQIIYYGGAVYAYDADTYQYIAKVRPPVSQNSAQFGWSVAAKDGLMAAGSFHRSDQGDDSGAAYLITENCFLDLNGDGSVDFFDISDLINGHPDYNGDGVFNFFDVSAFMSDYQVGCP